MKKIIFPIKEMPQRFDFDGDYHITQSAIFQAVLSEGETRLKNYCRCTDSFRVAEILKNLGYDIGLTDSEIIVRRNGEAVQSSAREISTNIGFYPTILLAGFLAGKDIKCRLVYGENVNSQLMESLCRFARELGIELVHEIKRRSIKIDHSRPGLIERRMNSAFPFFKNFLLLYGLCSGRPLAIREDSLSDWYFEDLILKLGGKIAIRDLRAVLLEDPDDPRKKVRRSATGYRKEMMLYPNTKLRDSTISVPPDSYEISAMITMAIMKRSPLRLENVPLSPELIHFLNHLKSSGVVTKIENRRPGDFYKQADVEIQGRMSIGRKIFGEASHNLVSVLPLNAMLLSVFPSTTVIRDVAEINDIYEGFWNELANNFGTMEIKSGILADGLVIEGREEILGGDFGSFRIPEISLAFYLVAQAGQGKSSIDDYEILTNRFPSLISCLESVSPPANFCESAP